MTRWIVCLPLMIAACAPAAGTGAPGGPRVETLSVENEIRGVQLTKEALAPEVVQIPLPQAWAALRAAYDSVGLVATGQNEAAGSLETGTFEVNGRLKGVRLSRYLDCGTQRGLDNADSYEVVMSVASRAIAANDGATRIASTVQGWAKPRGTAGSNRLTCGSTGQLEARLANLVRLSILAR